MPVFGGCRCGAVRYTIDLEALPLSYACHCRDCQTWSGSAFALHALLPDALLKILGARTEFRVTVGEYMASEHIGCSACMTRIANRNSEVPGMVILRAGTLDQSDELSPAVHIWICRKQSWLDIAGTPAFRESPTPAQFARALG
jgi:hypothetical protein